MNPNVQFGINFPSLDVQMRSLMQSFFSSQDEINKQMFSLLILNKFYTPDYIDKDAELEERNAGYQMGVTTASELLSNQLSRWLSPIRIQTRRVPIMRPRPCKVSVSLIKRLLIPSESYSVNTWLFLSGKNNRRLPCNLLIISSNFHFQFFIFNFPFFVIVFLIFFRQIVLVT